MAKKRIGLRVFKRSSGAQTQQEALRLPRFLRRAAPVSPCRSPTSIRTLLLCPSAGSSCVRRRVARRRFLSGSPCCRFLPRRNAGLPGSWAVLFLRAKVVHPAGCSLPSPTSLAGRPLLPSGDSAPWASGMVIGFVAAVPRSARSRAYASPTALPRPSQGSLPVGAVSLFAGRVSHPLDDIPNFMNSSDDSLLSDQNFLVALNLLPAKEIVWNSCDNRPKSLLDAVRGRDVAIARTDKDDCAWRSR